MKNLFVLGVLAIGMSSLTSCTSIEKAAPPVAMLGTPPKNCPVAKLEQGRGLYVGKCTKCHGAESIRDYEQTEWTGDILPTMSKKARLTPQEAEALRSYVLTVCSQPPQS